MQTEFIIYFIVATISTALPIPFIIYYTKTKDIRWIIFSVLSYSAMLYSYTCIFTSKNVAVLYPLIKILNVILVVLSSIVLFNNKLNVEIISGLFFAILSIYLLSSNLRL